MTLAVEVISAVEMTSVFHLIKTVGGDIGYRCDVNRWPIVSVIDDNVC